MGADNLVVAADARTNTKNHLCISGKSSVYQWQKIISASVAINPCISSKKSSVHQWQKIICVSAANHLCICGN
jgi:hypothetical protein